MAPLPQNGGRRRRGWGGGGGGSGGGGGCVWGRRRTPWLGLASFGSERIGAFGTLWLRGNKHGGVQRARQPSHHLSCTS